MHCETFSFHGKNLWSAMSGSRVERLIRTKGSSYQTIGERVKPMLPRKAPCGDRIAVDESVY